MRIQSGLVGPGWQIWVSSPVQSGNLYAQSGLALYQYDPTVDSHCCIFYRAFYVLGQPNNFFGLVYT